MKEIQSGADYAEVVIEGLVKIDELLPESEKLPPMLFEYWIEEIQTYADSTWLEYITGKRDHYEFDDNEIEELYNLAGMRFTQEILDGLVDKGMVEVGIGENGDLLYSTTDKGKQALDDAKEAE